MQKIVGTAFLLAALFALVFGTAAPRTTASSHREAPLISADPQADTTDVYAFVSPDRPGTVTLIGNWIPLEAPYGGPNFFKFGDDVRYEIHIDNNADAKPDVTYRFTFKTTVRNPATFLYNTGPIMSLDDPNWNVRQTYTVTRVEGGNETVVASDVKSPPVNIGPKSTPNYAALASAAVTQLPGGGQVFAGQRDDPFFVDLAAVFDLLTIRKLPGNAGGGVDGLKGYNTHTIAIQLPFSKVTRDGSTPSDPKAAAAIIGVWATSSRQSTKVVKPDGSVSYSGDWVQVSRLGHPLVNEVVAPVGAKDLFNASKPENDIQFLPAVVDPEVGRLFKALYNINVPPTPRDDLVAVFLTGVPGLTMPPDVTPSEELRLNLAIPGKNGPRMGVLAGDTSGFPNGRRLGDDVTDISLQAVAGAVYPLLHPDFKPDALADKLGDGVDANDVAFMAGFPYVAMPHPGLDGGAPAPAPAPQPVPPTLPDTSTDNSAVYFPETGYALGGEFLRYWRKHGGLEVFGYPINSEAQANGTVSQMFERNRFELHPQNAAPYNVLLGRLGAEVLELRGVDWRSFATVDKAGAGCAYFAETKHSVCGEFLKYWQSHGLEFDGKNGKAYAESLALFGLPLSEQIQETNAATGKVLTVQYFERARLEYHPENAGTAYIIQLGLLSRELGR
ncbi:MAG TPA: DUF4331 domain-containing protein [Herpetosiphonaceae bacterium]